MYKKVFIHKVYFPFSDSVMCYVIQSKRNFKISLYNYSCYFFHKQITKEKKNGSIIN